MALRPYSHQELELNVEVADQQFVVQLWESAHPDDDVTAPMEVLEARQLLAEAHDSLVLCAEKKAATVAALQEQMSVGDGLQASLPQRIASRERLRVLQKLDLPSTYANCMTASHLAGALIPAILENDRACITTALKTAVQVTPETAKLVLIRNTLNVGEIWISPALVEEARAQSHLEVSATASPMEFDEDGNLIAPLTCGNK